MSLQKNRIKLNELVAMIDSKQDRLKEIAHEEKLLMEELALLSNELMSRTIEKFSDK